MTQSVTAPQSGDNNPLIEHLKNNSISSLSIFVMGFGLIMIYAYHFHIEYFPQIGIDSLTSMIFATSYVGVILIVCFGVALFLPVLHIGDVWQDANKKNGATPQEKVENFVKWHVVALLSFLFWIVVVFFLVQFNISPVYGILSAISICALSIVLCRLIWLRKKGGGSPALKWHEAIWEIGTFVSPYIFNLTFQMLPMAMLALLIHGTENQLTTKENYIEPLFRVVYCYFLLLAFGAYFIVVWFDTPLRKLHKAAALVGMLISPMVVSFFLGNISFFPATIARLTKVGNFYVSEMTLSSEGCAVLAKQGTLSCPEKNDEPIKLCGAYVMSRLGSEAYLKVNFNQADKLAVMLAKEKPKNEIKFENVYLPSATILGMKVDSKAQATNIKQIDDYLRTRSSICPVEKAELKTSPYSFKATELFALDQSTLSSEGQKKLDALIKLMADNKKPIESLRIAGHTDQTGGSHYNLLLSQERALAVEAYLKDNLAHDIAPRHFYSQGYGNTRPKKTKADCPKHWPAAKQNECFAENRRVEIEVTFQ